MNKRVNLIIGSGVLGAYLSAELLKNNQIVVVTSRSLNKNFTNYKYLKIKNKIKFEKLNTNKKNEIEKIIKKYKPKKIFYFSGQSSLTKSIENEKETFDSHFTGTKNFLVFLKKEKLNTKFYKANSGYIFSSISGFININSTFSSNKNPYIRTQQKVFNLIKKYRKLGVNASSLVFMQIESPLRDKNFFIKKVCLGAKNRKKIIVGNINTFRDYSWVTEIVKAVLLTSTLKTKDFFISAGNQISGKEVIKKAYSLNGLNYEKYYTINQKFFRKNEKKFLIGSSKNSLYLKHKFKFKFNIFGKKLIQEMYKNL